jgi:hypothetical protein
MAEYESKYRRYVKGDQLHHPPIPESFDRTTSPQPTPRLDTGDQPGPQADGPRDPRLVYPRTINTPRPAGQGCGSCKWNGQCKILYWQKNFGFFYRENAGDGVIIIDPKIGVACESWNVDFAPLPPEAYDQDGLGLGDPVSNGTVPDSAYDPFVYRGQYGDLRFGLGSIWDSWNA